MLCKLTSRVSLIVAGWLLMLNLPATHGQEPSQDLSKAIASAAANVAKYIGDEPEAKNSVKVGRFDVPNVGGGGAAISSRLTSELEKHGLTILGQLAGGYRVTGLLKQPKAGKNVFILEVQIFDSGNNMKSPFNERFRDEEFQGTAADLLTLFNKSVDTTQETPLGSETDDAKVAKGNGLASPSVKPTPKPERSPKKRLQKIVDAVSKPGDSSVVERLDNSQITRVRFAENSPYGVQLVKKTANNTFVPCPIEKDDSTGNFAKAKLGQGDVYRIQIINETGDRVGAKIMVDGVNMYHFSQKWSPDQKMLISPGNNEIPGWHDTDSNAFEFEIVELGQAVASELNVFDDVGVITVSFFATQKPKGGDLATGKGSPTGARFKEVNDLVITDMLLGSISIRYVRTDVFPTDVP